MKEISIEIPEAQVPFMMELLQKLKFVKIHEPSAENNFKLSKSQKESVEAERVKSKKDPDYLLDWESVKNTLKVD